MNIWKKLFGKTEIPKQKIYTVELEFTGHGGKLHKVVHKHVRDYFLFVNGQVLIKHTVWMADGSVSIYRESDTYTLTRANITVE